MLMSCQLQSLSRLLTEQCFRMSEEATVKAPAELVASSNPAII